MGGRIENSGYAAFFTALLDGRLKLGQVVTQEQLCNVLGMSLSPLREVTTLLEAEGLIQIRRRLGIAIFYPDVKFVGNTFQFRELLECEGLRKFALVAGEGWVERMERGHREIIALVEKTPENCIFVQPVRNIEREFHFSFVRAFDNEQILLNYERLFEKMYLLRLLNPEAVGQGNTLLSMREHLEVIEAIRRRDANGAVDALKRHMRNVLHRILTH